jgi:hypothetical protein
MSKELIIALISLVGGGVITFLIAKHFRERKSLAYQILSKMSLINVNPKVRDKIKIDYDGKPAENIFSFKVRVINEGNVPIKDQPILFEFDKEAKVLIADYNTKPEKEFGEIKREDTGATNEAKFVIGLLNTKSKKEQIEFNFITIDNKNDEIKLHAKGENLEFREIPTPTFKPFMAVFMFVFLPVFSIIFIAIKTLFTQKVIEQYGYPGKYDFLLSALSALSAVILGIYTSFLLLKYLIKKKYAE